MEIDFLLLLWYNINGRPEMSNGKGDKRRPISITYEEFRKKYEEIFAKKDKKKDK